MNLMRRGLRDDPIRAVDACADVASYPGMPALVMHGALDTVVTDRNATQLGIAFARLNRLVDEHGAMRVGEQRTYARDDADYVDYLKAGRLVVRVCIVRRLPHAWSGGDPREPFHSATGPDATAMFWQFFVANAASGCDDVRQPRRPTARGAVTRSRPVRQLRRVLSIAGAPDRDPDAERRAPPRPLVTSMVPRWRLTMPCDTDKPSPVPLPDRLRREERIEDPPDDVGRHPRPGVADRDRHLLAVARRADRDHAALGIACAAFTSRFMNTWFNCDGRHSTCGTSP